MASVAGFAAVMAVAQGVAAQIAGDTTAGFLLGFFFFLLPVAAGGPVVAVLRKKISVRQGILGAAKLTGLSLLAVVVLGILMEVRSRPSRRSVPTIVLPPPNLKELLHPLDLESVPVQTTWEADREALADLLEPHRSNQAPRWVTSGPGSEADRRGIEGIADRIARGRRSQDGRRRAEGADSRWV
jgi:hypothetical protein